MKKLIIAFAGLVTLAVAAPASAQVTVQERVGPGVSVQERVGPGVSVREDIGGPPYGHAYGWRRHHAEFVGGCRTMRVKTRLPNGDVIIKTRRVCD